MPIFNRRLIVWVGMWLAVFALSSSPAVAAALKLATLVPEGSIWDRDLRAMGDQWKRKTDGRVSLRIYAGGVAGAESDILRKMRIGQLQAAALTVTGLEEIDPAFSVLNTPLFYDSLEEFLFVLDGLAPELEAKLEAKGYALLHWVHGGWARFFSRAPLHGIEDLRKQKIFVTAGADEMVSIWRKNGFRPVPLAETDIMTGFQTGMIDVLTTTPLAALSLQWFRQASFMHETGLAPLSGATIVKLQDWEKIAEPDREIMLADAVVIEKRQRDTIPEQNRIAIEEMSKRGLRVTPTDESAEWKGTAMRLAESMRGKLVPTDVYDSARALRDQYRSKAGSEVDAGRFAEAEAEAEAEVDDASDDGGGGGESR